jgi:hypothetical protein
MRFFRPQIEKVLVYQRVDRLKKVRLKAVRQLADPQIEIVWVHDPPAGGHELTRMFSVV